MSKECEKCGNTEGKCCWNRKHHHWMGKILFAIILVCSIGYLGHTIKMTPSANTKNDRYITIKTSGEKEVKADSVIWRVAFQNTGNDIKVLHEKFVKDRDAIVAFLKDKGFKEEELSIGSPRITDQFVRKEYGQDGTVRDDARYVFYSRVKVTTKNVDAVITAEKDLDQLVQKGITLPSDNNSNDPNPRYFLNDTLKIEQEVMDIALNKAKELAKQMADSLGVQLGDLRSSAQDGAVRIVGQYREDYFQRLKGPIKAAKFDGTYVFNIK